MYSSYITAAWETEPPYFFARFYLCYPGDFSIVLYNQILCDIFHSAVS